MSDQPAFERDLASIRNLMDRSVKFLSLSGLSGVLAGTYALGGAYYASTLLPEPGTYTAEGILQDRGLILHWLVVAVIVLVASLLTGFIMSARNAKKSGMTLWNETSRRLFVNLSVPLVAGGIFILAMVARGHYGIIAESCLLFYGLALVNASANLYDEVRWLGYSEIALGLLASVIPGHGLLFWSVGFGVLHIGYGAAMYFKYEK
ncbi:MAG: hypothetical protein K1X47_12400 [Cyclobacteriaceae bacterium]|nr:hypothetical protein [Cyclobacteriaceae bacterium]